MLKFEIVDKKCSEIVGNIVRESFKEQARILGITEDKYPNYVAFETSKQVENRMERMNEKVVISYLDELPIGTIRFSIDSNNSEIGHINRLAVLPLYRGKGHGEELMNFAESNFKNLGSKYVEIDIVAEFKKLEKYYKGLGYNEVGKKRFETLPFEVLFLRKNIG